MILQERLRQFQELVQPQISQTFRIFFSFVLQLVSVYFIIESSGMYFLFIHCLFFTYYFSTFTINGNRSTEPQLVFDFELSRKKYLRKTLNDVRNERKVEIVSALWENILKNLWSLIATTAVVKKPRNIKPIRRFRLNKIREIMKNLTPLLISN